MKNFHLIQHLLKSDHEFSRRDFIKSSGWVIACIGMVSCNDPDPLLEKVSWIELKTQSKDFALGVVLGNPFLCGGCRRCEIVCSSLKHPYLIRTESAAIKLDQKRFEGLFQKSSPLWHPDTCRQCKVEDDAPWCVNACPTGACHIDSETQARVIDQNVCIGCGSCVEACPYEMATLDILQKTLKAPEGTASKCDLCGGTPACVEECPSGALRFYTPWVRKKTFPGTI